MRAPLFQAPEVVEYDDEDRCTSLRRTVLRREDKDDQVVYVRCEATFGHPGKNHRSWIRKWTTAEEDGRLS